MKLIWVCLFMICSFKYEWFLLKPYSSLCKMRLSFDVIKKTPNRKEKLQPEAEKSQEQSTSLCRFLHKDDWMATV